MMTSVEAEIFETWWESPPVKVARASARWPRCSVAELMENLVKVLEARDDLVGKVDIVDLCGRMLDVEVDRNLEVPDRAVAHAQWAYRQGLSAEVTAEIFGLSEAEITEAARRTTKRDEALRLHGQGWTVKRIAQAVPTTETSVRRWLSDLDLEPNRARGVSPETRETIVQMRRQGVNPKRISERLNLTIDQVKQVIYGDRHKDLDERLTEAIAEMAKGKLTTWNPEDAA